MEVITYPKQPLVYGPVGRQRPNRRTESWGQSRSYVGLPSVSFSVLLQITYHRLIGDPFEEHIVFTDLFV